MVSLPCRNLLVFFLPLTELSSSLARNPSLSPPRPRPLSVAPSPACVPRHAPTPMPTWQECDDGGVGSEYYACQPYTDCTDCGGRPQSSPSPPAIVNPPHAPPGSKPTLCNDVCPYSFECVGPLPTSPTVRLAHPHPPGPSSTYILLDSNAPAGALISHTSYILPSHLASHRPTLLPLDRACAAAIAMMVA